MDFLKSCVFVIEKHPFSGLRLKILKDNKPVSPYSSTAPTVLRPMLRQVLLHKDISEHLQTLLTSYPQLAMQLKIKSQRHPCTWNPDLIYTKKCELNRIENEVEIIKEAQSSEIYLLSPTLCYFFATQQLGAVRSTRTIRHLSELDLVDTGSLKQYAKHLQDSVFTIDMFNQLPLFFSQEKTVELLSFKQSNKETSLLHITPKIVIDSQYAEKSQWVRLEVAYCEGDHRFPGTLNSYKEFSEKVSVFLTLPQRRKRHLFQFLIRFLQATPQRQSVLVSRFLKQLFPEEDYFSYFCPLFQAENQTLFQLKSQQDSWAICAVNFYVERLFWLGMILLFPEPAEVDFKNSTILIPRQSFTKSLRFLNQLVHAAGVTLQFSNKAVNVLDSRLRLDMREENEGLPAVFLGDQHIDIKQLESLKENFWSFIYDNEIKVMDAALIAQCEHILAIDQLQKQTAATAVDKPYKRLLHLLDWIQLRQSGVVIQLEPEQERLLQSFLSFKSLERIPLPKQIKFEPRQYQLEGLNWMMFLYKHNLGGVLADDMGLGKTFQSIMLLAAIKEQGVSRIDASKEHAAHLIVVPPSLMFNWQSECLRFAPKLSVSIYSGSERNLDVQSDIIITSYELLRRDFDLFLKKTLDVVIFDEAQFIKNQMSARTKAAQQINRQFCLCLTGTPIENHVGEYLTILNTAVPGFFPDSQRLAKERSADTVHYIVRRSKPFVLRRLKKQISHELKDKTEEQVVFTMTTKQQDVYNALIAATKKQMESLKGKSNFQYVMLTALVRLRQACVSPVLIDPAYTEITPKFTYLIEKIKVLQDEGHSALIFSQFIGSLDCIENLCKQENIAYFRIDGSVSASKRGMYVESFQQSNEPQVFLMSLKAGGFGLNLTKASYVFHIDPWWNPAVENQATDRVHRIGQTQHVFSYKLIMHNSIEEKIQEIKQKKSALFEMLLDSSAIVDRKQTLTAKDIEWLLN